MTPDTLAAPAPMTIAQITHQEQCALHPKTSLNHKLNYPMR